MVLRPRALPWAGIGRAFGAEGQQQIPFGNDNQKSEGDGKGDEQVSDGCGLSFT